MTATIEFQDVTKEFRGGTTIVDRLSLEVDAGEFLILVGPSGCGKTTALRMVAGLEEITRGEIRIEGERVNDMPPAERDIAMVFQNYALYPHMSVEENIAFPLRQRGVRRREVSTRVHEAAEALAIKELLPRKPRELSGGQRQRVAIGRALVRRPRAFLMDEPLSNLDAKLRVQMRAELIELHKRLGITTIYVTHDQTEAMTLGDRVVVLDQGVVQQVDTPECLYSDPANMFVAGFIGSPAMSFLRGRIDGATLRIGSHAVELPRPLPYVDREVVVGVRPEGFVPGNGSGLSAEVAFTEVLGPETLVHFRSKDLDVFEQRDLLVARFDTDAKIAAGDTMRLQIVADRVKLFDEVTGRALPF